MDNKIVQLYAAIRDDGDLLSNLATIEDPTELGKEVISIATQHGVSLTKQEIADAINNMAELIQGASENDELSDFELEMVSGGVASTKKTEFEFPEGENSQ
ncbi:MAG: hypothetical protein HQL50_02465 [Magnetococcales bacterium]|nr:hypothetical protein [Magnetococcales bacterium]